MHAHQRQSPEPALEVLMLRLRESCGQTADDESVHRVVVNLTEGHWTERLEAACRQLGLRVRWLEASVAEALPLARADLPLVTACSDGSDLHWWLVDAARGRKGRATLIGDPRGPRWFDPGGLAASIGGAEVVWGLIEPAFPASPMAASTAEGLTPVRRLVGLLGADRDDIVIVAVYAVAVGLLSLATPLAIQVLINWLAFGALLQPVVVLGVALLVFLTLAAALRTAQRVAVEVLERRIFVRMSSDLAARVPVLDVSSLDRFYGPELFNRFFDVVTVQKAVRSLVLDGLAALLQAGIGLLLLAVYHPVLLLFDVVVVGLVSVVWFLLGRRAAATAIVESKRKYEVAGWIEEMARDPLLFKLGGAQLGPDRADRLVRGYLRARADHFAIFLRQFVGMQTVQVLVSTALLVLCGWLVMEGQLTLGQLVAAEFIVTAALTGLAKVTDKLDTYYDLLAAVDKLGTLVDLPSERSTGLMPVRPAAGSKVELLDVSWELAGIPGGLRAVDLTLPPGSRTAVVGAPGTGMSALADLTLGVRHPLRGNVLRDGLDTRALHPDAVYADVALLRGCNLVAGTLRDNVVLGRPGLTTQSVLDALDQVGLSEVVARLPKGIDTMLSPTGRPLSQGHVRALMVARALVASPRLLVVDGFFDAMPASARQSLMAAVVAPDSSRTVLFLTEDPGLARRFDSVFEIVDGGLRGRPRITTV